METKQTVLGKTRSMLTAFSPQASMAGALRFTPRTQNKEVNCRQLHSKITCNSREGIMPAPPRPPGDEAVFTIPSF